MKPLKFEAGLQGRYQMTVRRADGTVRLQTPWFDNLILTNGLNRIGTGGIGSYCHVGSGSTAPLVTDTALQTFIGSTLTKQADVGGAQAAAPYYGWQRRTFRFGAGVAAGNVSEVGIGWDSLTGNLFSRALVRDEVGSPLTITVLSDEFLDVTYELRIYPPTVDTNFTFVMAGVTYTCVGRACVVRAGGWNQGGILLEHGSTYNGTGISGFTVYAGAIGTITGAPSGAQGGAQNSVTDTYSNNSLTRTSTAVFGLNNGNVAGGISAIRFSWYGLGEFQFSVSPPIPKDATKNMTLKCALSWARKTL